tara:strand:- start:758 stop:1546 length:789 start_codon:yes stop_codon:yes gene_type:complete
MGLLETGLRKVCRFIDRFIGVFYATSIYCGFHILTNGFNVTDEWAIIVLPFWLLTGIHWFKTRKPRITYDEYSQWIFYMERPYSDRSVFNPVERIQDIATNYKIPTITSVKGNKVKIQQDGGTFTRTAETFGMAGKYGKPTKSWNFAKQFCINSGVVDFKNVVNWTDEGERTKVRKQLERFRKDLSTGLGIPDFERGVDYTFHDGVFEWKSIHWHDTSIAQWEKEHIAEIDTTMRTKRAGAYIKASCENPDIPDYRDTDWYE